MNSQQPRTAPIQLLPRHRRVAGALVALLAATITMLVAAPAHAEGGTEVGNPVTSTGRR